MGRRNNTLMQSVGAFVIFIATLGMCGALAVALFIVGVYWAFEVVFSVGWWASLLIMLAVAALYLVALFGGIKLLGKGKKYERI